MKHSRLTATLAALAGLAALAAPAAAADATTQIRPGTLSRGPAGTVPHVYGSDLIDGDRHFSFAGREVVFLGKSGDDYLVGTWRQGSTTSEKVVRVTPDGLRTTVLKGVEPSSISLSRDGDRLIRSRYLDRTKQSQVKAWSSADGTPVAQRTFAGYISVLDADGSKMVLSGSLPSRTFWWSTGSNSTTRISTLTGYEASIPADRLAVLTGDPYQGGCSVVSTLSDPGTRIWRSCEQAVMEFSPSGSRVTTVHILTDGLGPGVVELHKVGGTLLHRWSTYYFGQVLFESGDTMLMLAHGKTKTAWVRCTGADCERTSKLTDTQL